MIECKLHSSKRQTAFGPFASLGTISIEEGVLEPLSGVRDRPEDRKALPDQEAHRRPDGHAVRVQGHLPDQRKGATRCAAFEGLRKGGRGRAIHHPEDPGRIHRGEHCQLREALEAIGGRYSRLPSHPYEREMLILEVDLTGLRASKRAEGSTKGYSPALATPPADNS